MAQSRNLTYGESQEKEDAMASSAQGAPSDDNASRAARPAAAPERVATSTRAVRRRLTSIALRPVYAFYLTRLRAEVMRYPRPRHVAVIMDGNRRWAVSVGLGTDAGHRAGAETALALVDWCATAGIGELTLWALSLENLDRSASEVGTISDVAADALDAIRSGKRRTKVPIQLHVIGRADLLPERLRESIAESRSLSHDDASMQVTVALGYSGREELVEAARATVRELLSEGVSPAELPDRLTPDAMERHLYTAGSSDPDLIIRTSGEVRLSGFLPWQSVHSEFYFCEVYWPAFREIDFLRAIRTYQQRSRRFGR
jgi:short-chain Z-isoprenyl diphosphate synthase